MYSRNEDQFLYTYVWIKANEWLWSTK